MSLTADQVRKARPRAQRYDLHDGGSLVLRVYPSGTKTWYAHHQRGGRRRVKKLGAWPKVSLRDARTLRDRFKERQTDVYQMSVAAFCEEYMEHWAWPYKRSAPLDRRLIDANIIPVIGDCPLLALERRDCTAVTDPIVERGALDLASRVHGLLRRILQYAIERGLRTENPARRINLPQSPSRDRALSPEEVRTFWHAVQASGASEAVRAAIELQLATGQRLGEITTIERGEIDLIEGVWTIPSAKAKNRVAHTVPLTSWARGVLERCIGRWPGKRYVIPISPDRVREVMAGIVYGAALPRATPHDLRRTVATRMAALGVDRTVQDRILNHVDQSVGGGYDRHTYDTEKREALERWAEAFGRITREEGT